MYKEKNRSEDKAYRNYLLLCLCTISHTTTITTTTTTSTTLQVASVITPVPGGVGPMTVAMLMNNTVIAAQKAAAQRKLKAWALTYLPITPLEKVPRLVWHSDTVLVMFWTCALSHVYPVVCLDQCTIACTTAPLRCWYNAKTVVPGTVTQNFMKVAQLEFLCGPS